MQLGRAAHWRVSSSVAALLLAISAVAGPALAASEDIPDQEFGVIGDWGGLRGDLKDKGWTFEGREKFEAATNVDGGSKEAAAAANELMIGVTADLQKLVGLSGGTVQAMVTDRAGDELGPRAGLAPAMQFIEVYGRGQRWRLTQLWYEQAFADKKIDLKLGRIGPGNDFDAFSCDFENLTFCGSTPGNLTGGDWYNWPVSQWGGRAKAQIGSVYLQAGAYQVNRRNLYHGFDVSFGGAQGVLAPAEVGWTPKLGSAGLPGTWVVGGWYSNVTAPDVLLDQAGDAWRVSGRPPLDRNGRYGAYLSIEQQVTGKPKGKGLTLFLNAIQADRRTSLMDRQIALGATYQGLIPGRDKDQIALAAGWTHFNSRAAAGERLALDAGTSMQPPQHTEFAVELDYRFKPLKGLVLTPNLQVVRDVGGVAGRKATVLGFKAVAKL